MWIDVLSVTLRALSFLGLFQAAGIAIFLAWFDPQLTVTERTLRQLGTRSAFVAACALTGQYILEAARMSGDVAGAMDPTLQGLVLHSATSVAFSWRLLGLLLIILGLRRSDAVGTTVGVSGVVILLTAFTLIGHTSNDPLRWLLRPVLLVHLVVVAFWFGALAPLYLVSSREQPATAARVLEAFSARAIWLVPGLLLAGLVLATALLPNVAALGTPYGRLLTAKVIGFCALMVFAVWNRWRLCPELRRGDVTAARKLRLSLAAEYLLIAAVLSVTAALTMFFSPGG